MSRLNIPTSCIVPLSRALKKVFDDGKDALTRNASAPQSVMDELVGCEQCVSGRIAHNVAVVDGDSWEASVHGENPDNSVDMVLELGEHGRSALLPVEGKLGLAYRFPGDRKGASLTLAALENKYLGLVSLINGGATLLSKLIVLIPKDGQEHVWYLVRNWNHRTNRVGKILSCCVNDFLQLFGIGGRNRAEKCSSDAFRIELLKSEFSSLDPMAQVQLPSAGFCTGCGKCRDVCPCKAIAIVPDINNGDQIHAFVDKQSCKLNCRACESVCPILHPSKPSQPSQLSQPSQRGSAASQHSQHSQL